MPTYAVRTTSNTLVALVKAARRRSVARTGWRSRICPGATFDVDDDAVDMSAAEAEAEIQRTFQDLRDSSA
jgi:hypothetical protein